MYLFKSLRGLFVFNLTDHNHKLYFVSSRYFSDGMRFDFRQQFTSHSFIAINCQSQGSSTLKKGHFHCVY